MTIKDNKKEARKHFFVSFSWIIAIWSLLFTLFFFFLLLIFWTESNFGVGLSIQQILVNLFSTLYGMDTELCISLAKRALYAIGTGIIFFLYFSGFFTRWWLSKKRCFSGMDARERSELIHSRLTRFYHRNKIICLCFTLILFLVDCRITEKRFGIVNYLYHGVQMSGIFDNYRVPDPLEIIAPSQKRNFVLIISESLEETYSREDIFGEDLLSEITALKNRGESAKNWVQVDGTNWTMASLIAVLYGIPRRFVWDEKDFGDKGSIQVLRQARSIFHVLNEQGYEIVFVEGSNLAFSGRDRLFRNMPWMKTLSYVDLSQKDEYLNFIKTNQPYSWGIHDRIVLSNARKEYERLSTSNRPYALVVQLLDTHGDHGFLVPEAERKFGDFRDVVREQIRMISQFVQIVYSAPGSENTSMMIMGDHIVHANTLYKKLIRIPNRKIVNLWINGSPNRGPMSSDPCTTFDFAPSILEFLGFRWNDHRFGVGISCFSTDQKLLEKYTSEEFQKENDKRSETYNKIFLGTDH